MNGKIPKFMDSPYFVRELFNWHLKPGAPKEIVDEFNEYMKQTSLDPGGEVEEIEEVRP